MTLYPLDPAAWASLQKHSLLTRSFTDDKLLAYSCSMDMGIVPCPGIQKEKQDGEKGEERNSIHLLFTPRLTVKMSSSQLFKR